ncbi:MAG: hypothetical protein HQL96_01660, partial [Magnetococcales bacterium]|nr:hypothetical protein [Magnetococcales bacterium]
NDGDPGAQLTASVPPEAVPPPALATPGVGGSGGTQGGFTLAGESTPPKGGPPTNALEFRQAFGCWPWAIPWQEPHPGRATQKPEIVDGMFWHWCRACGRWGSVGIDVSLKARRLGMWRCQEHAEGGCHPAA